MPERTYRPPETGVSRLEIRDPVTQGRLAWGYISDDESLIMNDSGEVWVRHGPKEVFGSEMAAENFIQEEVQATPDKLSVTPYDYAPLDEHVMRVIANKQLHNSVTSRLVRWLMVKQSRGVKMMLV